MKKARKRAPRPRLTSEEKAERRAARLREKVLAAANAKAPQAKPKPRVALSQTEKAMRIGRRTHPEMIRYFLEVARGQHVDATHADRRLAWENVADRTGMPRRTDSALPMSLPPKLFELRGYQDAEGVFHHASAEELAAIGVVVRGQGGMNVAVGINVARAGGPAPSTEAGGGGVVYAEQLAAVAGADQPGAPDPVELGVREGED